MKPKNTRQFALFATASAALLITSSTSFAATGTWLGTSGNWGTPGIWSGGTVADGTGFSANFTGINITANQTINLNTNRTIGTINFTDLTTASHDLAISGANILTLDVASGNAIINVTNQTLSIASQISGNDGLQKNGAGSLVLSGNNNYTGVTTVSAGNLNIQHANALGATGAGNGTSVAIAGQLQLQGGNTYAAEALSLVTATTTAVTMRSISGNNEWTGTITPTGGGSGHFNRIQSDADTLTLSGELGSVGTGSRYSLQGAGNITVSGKITGTTGIIGGSVGATATSIRTLSNNLNDYSSTTSVSGGVLSFASIANVSGGASALGAPTTSIDGTISVGSGTVAGVLRYTGSGHSSDRVINLSGTTGNATIESSGSGALVLTSATTATGAGIKTLTLGGTNTGNNSIGPIVDNSLTNKTSVTKADAGKWIITGTSGYTGNTSVTDGTLVINGNISTSLLTTVATGATIEGNGTTGALTISSGGFVAPGNSPGIFTVSGNYSQQGTYTAEINGLTAGTQHDRIVVNGTVNIAGGSLATLFTANSYAVNDMIFILLNDSSDAITGTFAGLAQGASIFGPSGYEWQISYVADSVGSTFLGGNDIALQVVAIPEPTAALLGGLGLLALLRRRR